jgi:hypothetical protein
MKIYKTYISSLIIKLIININVIITFTIAQPSISRCSHSSVLLNYKIYIGGGLTGPDGDFANDFFSIDLEKPFFTSPNNIPYAMREDIPVMTADHTFVYAKNENGGVIYLLGGYKNSPESSSIYGYVKVKWKSIKPKVRDGIIIPYNSTTRVVGVTITSSNNIYIFDNGTIFTYDAWNNFWDASDQYPFRLEFYAAVMLNSGEIVYIGGSNGTANVPMSQVN